jgi:hypothetical protein
VTSKAALFGVLKSQTLNGQSIPSATVLVDAKTFVPIENVTYSTGTEGGHSVLQSTKVRYLTYQELAASPADGRLLSLAIHPGAKTVTEPSPKEHQARAKPWQPESLAAGRTRGA